MCGKFFGGFLGFVHACMKVPNPDINPSIGGLIKLFLAYA